MGNLFESKLNQNLVTGALIAVIIALASYAYVSLKQAHELTTSSINITGKAEVAVTPDVATFSFSVHAEGKDAAEAQTKSATAINDITAYLKEQGVADKDIQTAGYNVSPKYSYNQKPCALGMYCPPSDPVQTGVDATQQVTVKVRKLDTAGTILAGVGQKGATDISSLTMSVDDIDKIKLEARGKAIADARAQADVLAKQLGVHLGEVISYYEDMGGMPEAYGGAMPVAMSAKADMAPVAPTITSGEQKVTSQVTVTYKLR
jgi:uncharacterized protein